MELATLQLISLLFMCVKFMNLNICCIECTVKARMSHIIYVPLGGRPWLVWVVQ